MCWIKHPTLVPPFDRCRRRDLQISAKRATQRERGEFLKRHLTSGLFMFTSSSLLISSVLFNIVNLLRNKSPSFTFDRRGGWTPLGAPGTNVFH